RDRCAAIFLRGAAQESAEVQGHQGARRYDLVATAPMDTGEALARLRDVGEVEGSRSVGGPLIDGCRVPRALRAAPGEGARSPCRARERSLREMDGTAGKPRARVQRRPAPLARDDARPHRD